MAAKGKFQVTVKKIDVVKPQVAIQEYWLPQSNLDLLLPPINPTSFYCYKKPVDEKHTFDSMVSILKNALARTLVPFCPLAGEMQQNAVGEPELLCNSRGVDFVEAYADIELVHLNFYNPDESIGGKFVAPLRRGVYSFQEMKKRKKKWNFLVCTRRGLRSKTEKINFLNQSISKFLLRCQCC